MSSRRSFDSEFKREAVRLATRGDKSLAQVARDLGISSNLLSLWKSKLKNDPEFSFPGKGRLTPHEEEIRKLKKALRDAEEERDILKKAWATSPTKSSPLPIHGRSPHLFPYRHHGPYPLCVAGWLLRLAHPQAE